jgi:RNA polymerase sigma-70 factor (ECF subfamily)
MQPSDEVLIAEFYDGDNNAFTILMNRYNSRLYRFARSIGLNHADAEDQTQSTFVKVFTGRDKKISGAATGWYDATKGVKFRTWLFTIQHNNCIEFLRHTKVNFEKFDYLDAEDDVDKAIPRANHESEAQLPDDVLITRVDQTAVRNALESLAAKERVVIELRYYFDDDEDGTRTLNEIAQTTGVSTATVHRLHSSALRNLGILLKKASEEGGQ